MNLQELNARFGAPGRIVFHDGFAGYPEAVIAGKYGSAEIALLGGTVLSYRPTGHSQVLFRPAKRDYNRGDGFHGGIPVCWPQFGNRFSKTLPQHGFARKMVFEVRGTEYSEDMTELTLGLKSSAVTRELWPHEFDLELKVSVSMKLNLTLTTRNTGSEPLEFSCGLHPYLLVRDYAKVTVAGLDGANFTDMAIGRGCDRVYELASAPRHEFAVLDPGLRRALALAAAGHDRAVVWNPGEGGEPADMVAGDAQRFVCVEPVSDWPGGRTLAPGESHQLTLAIQSNLEMEGEN